MNNISKLTATLALGISLLICTGCVFALANSSVKASGRKAERNYSSVVKNRDIREIVCKGMTDVRFTQGSGFSVIVRGSDNLIDFTKIDVEGDKLIVSDKKFGNVDRYDNVAYITLPNVSSFTLEGVSDVEVTNTFRGQKLRIKMNGTGEMDVPSMSVDELLVNLNGTGDLDCAGHAVNATLNMNGTGDINANLKGGNYTNVVANGTGDVTLIGNCKAAKYFAFGTGNINARKYIVADVEARATGTGDLTCYATSDFSGYRNTIASLTCYGGPRNRNTFTKGIVFPQVNESVAEAKTRVKESGKMNEYASALNNNADSYATRTIRKNGKGGNGRLIVIENGKVIEDTRDDGREYMGNNNLRTRSHSNGNVELMYYDEDGNLVIDRQTSDYLERNKNSKEVSEKDELERQKAEIERTKAEIARTKAEIQRNRDQIKKETNSEIAKTRAELARVRAELARERATLARERANRQESDSRRNLNNDINESDYIETETVTIHSGNKDENVELKYDTRANKWVMYLDGVKVDRKVKSVSPSKKVTINKSTARQSEKNAKVKTYRSRRQSGVWENGSERTIFFEDGGQVTIFTDENGRQRIINEE